MPVLSKFKRAAIIGQLQMGKKKATIAKEMGVTRSCLTKIARKVEKLGAERSQGGGDGGGPHQVLGGPGGGQGPPLSSH